MSIIVVVRTDNIRIELDDWDDAGFDKDGNLTQKAKEFTVNHMMNFVEDFRNKLDGFVGEKVLANEAGSGVRGDLELHELNANLIEANFDDWDNVCLFIPINKEIDASELNDIFLDMPKFGQFMAIFPNHVELVTQLYDWGEHDTGYFADWVPEDNYIIGFANEDGSYKQNEEKPYYDELLKTYNHAIKELS
tara:strand:+ start:1373 stop:1948 length:576 start_codon:yes stop_codon:yes gene_type:complete